MKKFETPEIEVVKFSVVDVLTASSTPETTLRENETDFF